jgi:uncharacterized protein (DUF1778 family)
MAKRKPPKGATGGSRMSALGYKPIQFWVDAEELETLQAAAKADRRPLTKFVLRAALKEAWRQKKRRQEQGEGSI